MYNILLKDYPKKINTFFKSWLDAFGLNSEINKIFWKRIKNTSIGNNSASFRKRKNTKIIYNSQYLLPYPRISKWNNSLKLEVWLGVKETKLKAYMFIFYTK